MEVSNEKLSQLAENLKKLRVLRDENGKLFIRENEMSDYENLSENMQIVEENFKYFSKRPTSLMYPDEFILAIKILPNGSRILADNLEYILEEITHRANRVIPLLAGIPEISEKVADNFEDIFNLMIYNGAASTSKTNYIENLDTKYVSHCIGNRQEKFAILMRIIRDSEKAGEVLENNKELFLNSDFNAGMAEMVKILSKNPECHDFIKNNFDTIRENCYVPDLAKLYCNIREICPEHFKKEAFLIDKIYIPAKEKTTENHTYNEIEKICSRIIEQGRTKDLETLIEFLMQNATIEPGTLKFLGCGWFNMAIQAGDKAIKLGAPDGESDKPKIPYHPRLLQPIIRKNDKTIDPKHPLGIEIYEVVDMDTEISDEEILEVYKELREAGIKWADVKRENLGRLRKDNYPYEIGYNVPLPPEFLGIEDSEVERKILKAGQLVIIDLDCLEMAKNEKGYNFTQTAVVPDCVRKYELEYQERINPKKPEIPEEH